MSMGQNGDGAGGLSRVQGKDGRGCGLSRGSVQGRGLVLSLWQGMDGLEPVVRARTGPRSEPQFREVTGPGPEPGVMTKTGLRLGLGQGREWVRA